jgi:phage terminase small subunit
MTPRQQRFVDEYLIDLNGTRAATRAGYGIAGAKACGTRLLRWPEIAAALDTAMAARALRTGITRERVLEEYARIAFAEPRLLKEWGPAGIALKDAVALSDASAALIAAIEYERPRAGGGGGLRIAVHDKQKALATLARILGLTGDALCVTVGSA